MEYHAVSQPGMHNQITNQVAPSLRPPASLAVHVLPAQLRSNRSPWSCHRCPRSVAHGCTSAAAILSGTICTWTLRRYRLQIHGRKRVARGSLVADMRATSVLTLEKLHAPIPVQDVDLVAWCNAAFAEANVLFFRGSLVLPKGVEVDRSWHLRGGAGGANPSANRIIIDPTSHNSLRDLCSTLLHEMIHIEIEGADGQIEHGKHFIERCLELNEEVQQQVQGSGTAVTCGANCRLGEFDAAVDRAVLEDAGVEREALTAFLTASHSNPEPTGDSQQWDTGLLVQDLRTAGSSDFAIATVLASCSASACRRALEAPGGYSTWQLRSQTIARYFASRVARDYQFFADYESLWQV